MKLVIVESPTKAKTISKFLGSPYAVESSYGHLRDLPKSKLGIDLEHNFEPQYVIPKKVERRVTALKKTAAKAEEVILATDEDREGEAIAWHIAQIVNALGNKGHHQVSLRRIVFHEITQAAIEAALANPRSIDMHLVDAQQARRVLDRLVGYKLSPFLWKKVRRGLSAGRVQSVALRLIVEREEEIKKFTREAYWTITASLLKKDSLGESGLIEATLVKINGDPVPKPGIRSKEEAENIRKDLESSDYKVVHVDKKEAKKNPLPPFITSTLQQAAAQRLGFSSKKTMLIAQQLYESGHITYMRTDSVHIAQEALVAARNWIRKSLGEPYLLPQPRTFKTKSRLAQEAHEAIRPTEPNEEPERVHLGKDQGRLYTLIWSRFIASQLPPARFDTTSADVEAQKRNSTGYHLLRVTGTLLRFDGFLKIWPIKFEDNPLLELKEGEILFAKKVAAEEHHTEPPPRYNEASLVKTMEKYGIGRPSTYAPIVSVIQERDYVEKNQGRFYPTEIGTLVNKVLVENFPEIFNVAFTAKMEEDLDEVAEGEMGWRSVVQEFYDPFAKLLEQKYVEVSKKELTEEKTDILCERCGKPMVIRFGRFGRFLACSGYPECKNTRTLKEPPKRTGLKCPKCGEGEVIERRVNKKGRARGKIFWGCSRYPDCDYASWTNPLIPPAGENHKEKHKEKNEGADRQRNSKK